MSATLEIDALRFMFTLPVPTHEATGAADDLPQRGQFGNRLTCAAKLLRSAVAGSILQRRLIADEGALLVDVRDANELAQTGKVGGFKDAAEAGFATEQAS